MVPVSLPEFPKPSRTPGKSQKPVFENPKMYIQNNDKSPYTPYIYILELAYRFKAI